MTNAIETLESTIDRELSRIADALERIAASLEGHDRSVKFDAKTAQILDAVRGRYENRTRGAA